MSDKLQIENIKQTYITMFIVLVTAVSCWYHYDFFTALGWFVVFIAYFQILCLQKWYECEKKLRELRGDQ